MYPPRDRPTSATRSGYAANQPEVLVSWLPDLLQHGQPDKLAIRTDEASVTYRELTARIARAAGWLTERGVQHGDVVALQLPRSLAFLELHLAALGLGAATLPLNPAASDPEVAHAVTDAGARLAILLPDRVHAAPGVQVVAADPQLRPALDRSAHHPLAAPPDGDTPAVLLYTSGTTGRPKGALLSHTNVRATVEALVDAWRWRHDDVLLHVLPLFHVHGLFVAQHAALRAGATTLWADRFDAAEALARIERDRVTVFMGVPTLYSRILALPDSVAPDLSSMRLFTSGSAPLPARDHRAFEARTGHRILERYGMTEVGIALSNPYEGERRPGAVGHPVPGARVRVTDPETGEPCAPGEVGELQISGPSVFAGYLNRPEHTARALVDGWMRSGDLGFVDDDGYFHIVGRRADLILSGGYNVYPAEVEAVLVEHPAVAEASVVGVPDPDLGERVVATVVAAAGPEPAVLDLVQWCRDRLAPYKCPRAIRTATALPRNPLGKIVKAPLRADWTRLVLRRGTPADLDGICAWNIAMALETESLDLDEATVRRGVSRVLGHDESAWYVLVEVADQVVGQCMVTVEWSDWRDRPVWWFQSVFVPPQWRGRGVFRALYEGVVAEARRDGAGGVRLYVDRRNIKAQAAYRALGMNGDHYAVFEAMFDEPPAATAAGIGLPRPGGVR
jgi:malonyl-CoA/methylmalonyl-CoA synthetase